jgi:hypothetical protein
MRRPTIVCTLVVLILAAGSAQADLVNGNFETGLTGWSVFTTVNGTVGVGMPDTVLFDTNNDGIATSSARFNVGRLDFDAGGRSGGGIYQNVDITQAGAYQVQAYTAVLDNRGGSNGDGGLFELLFDGVVVDSFDYGAVTLDVAEHQLLATVMDVTVGLHDVRLRMGRNYLSSDVTPWQFIDDVSLTVVPVPAAVLLGLLGLSVAGARLRKKSA